MKTFNQYLNEFEEIGFVEEVIHSLVIVSGLPGAFPHEIIVFESGQIGEVFTLSSDSVTVLLFSKESLKIGTRATRTNQTLQIPVDENFLGHVINPLGITIDNSKPPNHKDSQKRFVHQNPSDLHTRALISQSCETGVSLVDMMIPLGRGQRELIIGDRKTGKSNFLLKTVLTQAGQGVICVYTTIGKKKQDIKKAHEFFQKHGVSKNVVIVASNSQDSAGMIYITPYTAITIAEYFKDTGKHVLIVLDDLTTHAKYYREISLLAKRFPGRNSYPGDIFYVHAKLLERAGNFKTPNGDASLTCIPIVESLQGDLTGYIQTNIMSMTDGHVFFDSDLFAKGRRPAINPFLSVTRVGRQTQTQLRQEINRELTSFFTLYEKIQNFVHFGAELSENIKLTLATGDRMLSFFSQTAFTAIAMNAQILVFCMLWNGVWTHKTSEDMKTDMDELIVEYRKNANLRSLIDQLVTGTSSFNELLQKMREQENNVLRFVSKKPTAVASEPTAVASNAAKPTAIPKPKTKPTTIKRGSATVKRGSARKIKKLVKKTVKSKKTRRGKK